jgi:hypothetical protein
MEMSTLPQQIINRIYTLYAKIPLEIGEYQELMIT